ncbi:hypothetical protein BD289DRAFT_427323 [Coniella lustricola]|uniref:Uncharacterized protein n=1 Tax=Coniella lustricola TaxID=2025994 RepID=A0A2T3AFF3_9PEZI|nr:hypothetical protein BD289DRAFT_427323 [Coniella lustricola]
MSIRSAVPTFSRPCLLGHHNCHPRSARLQQQPTGIKMETLARSRAKKCFLDDSGCFVRGLLQHTGLETRQRQEGSVWALHAGLAGRSQTTRPLKPWASRLGPRTLRRREIMRTYCENALKARGEGGKGQNGPARRSSSGLFFSFFFLFPFFPLFSSSSGHAACVESTE